MVQSSNIEVTQGNTENSETIVLNMQENGNFSLPEGFAVGDATLTQEGQSLILKFSEGDSFAAENYFSHNDTPLIQDSNGGSLNKGLVNSFLTSSPEYAQNGSMNDVSPVGAVEEIKGSATVIRVSGEVEDLTLGTPIYEGDVIETSSDGALNVMFIDETSLAVSEGARVAVDEYSYDADTESGVTDLSVLKGVFVYTSGLIGRDDPDDVKIDTPVGSIGIRGTVIAGKINPDGESEISVLEGAIVVKNGTGETTLSQQYETVKLLGFEKSIEYKGVEAAENISKTYGSVSDVVPNLFSSINDNATEQVKENKAEQDAEDTVEVEAEDSNETSEENTNLDSLAEDVLEAGEGSDEFIAIETKDSINTNNQTLDENINTKSALEPNRISSTDTVTENLFVGEELPRQDNPPTSAEPDPTPVEPEPTFTTEFKPLFEQTKTGQIVGTITTADFPVGTTVAFGIGGSTSSTAGEFDIIESSTQPGTYEISLNIDLGVAGTTLTPIHVIAALPNGATTFIAFETPVVEDAVVNLNSAGGYEYTVNGATQNNAELNSIRADVNGDGIIDTIESKDDSIDTDLHNNIFINNTELFGNANYGFDTIDNIGDINNDGYDDFVVGAQNYSYQSGNNSVYNDSPTELTAIGKIGIITGSDTGSEHPSGAWFRNPELADGEFTGDNTAIGAVNDDQFGSAVAGIGDFDGDGKQDILVGSINNEEVGVRSGSAFILTNYQFDGTQNDNSITSSTHIEAKGGTVGYSKYLDGIEDFNGDGLSDVMIGYDGGVQIVYGGTALGEHVNHNDTTKLNITRSFSVIGTDFVTGASAGDINGDGFDDFAVSHDDGTDINTYIVYGQNGITTDLDLNYLENPDNALKINHAGASGSNYQITALGDIDGDGFDDIQIGIEGGQQFTVHGEPGGSAHVIVTDNSADDANNNTDSIAAQNNNVSLVGDVAEFYDGDQTGVRMTGGGSDNTFRIDNDDFARIHGGEGFDTIELSQGNAMLDFTSINFEQIQGIEEIEFGAINQTITLTAENIFNLLKTSDNGELRISGEGTVKLDAVSATNMQDFLSEGNSSVESSDITYTGAGDGLAGYFGYHIGGYDLYIEADPNAATTVNFV